MEDFSKRDRLNELPNEVLINILSYLPTIYAVRTMLLRRFGNLWTFVPDLDFDSSNFTTLTGIHIKRFPIFVRNALMLHSASVIDSFKLNVSISNVFDGIGFENKNAVNDIHMWIKCVVDKKVKTVDLQINDYYEFPLPDFLFTDPSVTNLSLSNCNLGRPKRVQMESLRNLSLSIVYSDADIFELVISGSPLLRYLYLDECCVGNVTLTNENVHELVYNKDDDSYDHIFDCPNINVLDLSGSEGRCKATNLSSVRNVSITFFPSRKDGNFACQTTEFLKKLENADILTFNGLAFKDVTFPKNRWKIVTLTNEWRKSHALCIDNLLRNIDNVVRNSPCMEELTIIVTDWSWSWSENANMKSEVLSEELFSPCVALAPHLRTVNIDSYTDHDHELNLQLVEYLLKSGVVLDELVISQKRGKQLTLRNKHNLSNKFSYYTKASAKARITFY